MYTAIVVLSLCRPSPSRSLPAPGIDFCSPPFLRRSKVRSEMQTIAVLGLNLLSYGQTVTNVGLNGIDSFILALLVAVV